MKEDWSKYAAVIGVTDAILKKDVPFTAWCHQEGCGHKPQFRYQRWGETVHALKVDVWGLPHLEDRWHFHWSLPYERIKCDLLPQDIYEKLDISGPEKLPSGPFAYFRAAYEGYKEIDIFGSDFAGHCNFDPNTGEPLDRTLAASKLERMPDKTRWDRRWKVEKAWLIETSHVLWEKHGIKLRSHSVPRSKPKGDLAH